MLPFLSKLFDTNEREIKRLTATVQQINELEPKMQKLKDGDFAKKTDALRKRVEKGESLENLLPEAFALVESSL